MIAGVHILKVGVEGEESRPLSIAMLFPLTHLTSPPPLQSSTSLSYLCHWGHALLKTGFSRNCSSTPPLLSFLSLSCQVWQMSKHIQSHHPYLNFQSYPHPGGFPYFFLVCSALHFKDFVCLFSCISSYSVTGSFQVTLE